MLECKGLAQEAEYVFYTQHTCCVDQSHFRNYLRAFVTAVCTGTGDNMIPRDTEVINLFCRNSNWHCDNSGSYHVYTNKNIWITQNLPTAPLSKNSHKPTLG